MAASGKKKSGSGGRPTGKGQNSRTGGSATPRAPKPRTSAEDEAPPEKAKRGWGAKARDTAPASKQRSSSAKKAPAAGGKSAKGNKKAAIDVPSPRATKATRSGESRTRDPQPQPRARRDRPASSNGNGRAAEPVDEIDLRDDPADDLVLDADADADVGEDGYETDDAYDEDGYEEDDDEGDDEGDDVEPPASIGDRVRLFVGNLTNPSPAAEGDAAPAERRPARAAVEDEYLPDGTRVPRWGFGDVLVGLFLALFLPSLGFLVLSALGYVATTHAVDLGGDGATLGEAVGRAATGQATTVLKSTDYAPILLQKTLLEVLLWTGLMGATAWAVWRKGNGFVQDLKLRFRWIDVPLGLGIGVLCQLILIPVLYWGVNRLFGDQDVSAVARQITDDAVDPFSTVIVFLTTAFVAPVVEEIYYRGLVLRAGEKKFGGGWALAISSAFFAITHGYLIVLPGIFLFGLILGFLALRTNRLGPPIFAHIGFNVVTASVLIFHLNLPLA